MLKLEHPIGSLKINLPQNVLVGPQFVPSVFCQHTNFPTINNIRLNVSQNRKFTEEINRKQYL